MKTKQQGMTLIELMIVVAIIGILAAIAYPSYRDQVRRSNRTEAKVALERVAQQLEKCFTRFMTYEGLTAVQCPTATQAQAGFLTEDGHYRITAAIPRGGAPAGASSFLLTATLQGAQAQDIQCGNFMVNELGFRDVSAAAANRAICW